MPSSRTSVRRVDPKSVFCRTGAALGTYVMAMKGAGSLAAYRLRIM